MKKEISVSANIWKALWLVIIFFLIQPALFSQYREYHLFGIVVDTESNPLQGVDVILQELSTSVITGSELTKEENMFSLAYHTAAIK